MIARASGQIQRQVQGVGLASCGTKGDTHGLPSEEWETSMSEIQASEPNAAGMLEQLREAIDVICEDAARAELWASALSAFAQPAPQYAEPDCSSWPSFQA